MSEPRRNEDVFNDDREKRRQWAREVLARLGIGLARDESGFYRPAQKTLIPVQTGRRSGKRNRRMVCESLGQAVLPFAP
jgi:hypothetical protein